MGKTDEILKVDSNKAFCDWAKITCNGHNFGAIEMAPIGNPLPIPLAIEYISAFTPAKSCE